MKEKLKKILCRLGLHKTEDLGEVYSRVSVNGQKPHLYKCKWCGVEEKAIYVSQKDL